MIQGLRSEMYPRVLLNSDGLAHVLRQLLKTCKDNRKGKINNWMSPFNFMVRFWAAFRFHLNLDFTTGGEFVQH